MLKKCLVIGLIAVLVVSAIAFAATFSDLSAEHWAYNYVTPLVEKGVISGYPDGTFKPEKTVSRAEFLKLIMTALHDKEGYYTPIEGEHWAMPYYKEAEEKGYLKSGTKGRNLDEEITREEMAHILSKICTANNIDNFDINSANVVFSDIDELSSISQTYIMDVAYKGLVSGYPDGTFGPKKTVTRAECATIITRFMNIKEKMEKI